MVTRERSSRQMDKANFTERAVLGADGSTPGHGKTNNTLRCDFPSHNALENDTSTSLISGTANPGNGHRPSKPAKETRKSPILDKKQSTSAFLSGEDDVEVFDADTDDAMSVDEDDDDEVIEKHANGNKSRSSSTTAVPSTLTNNRKPWAPEDSCFLLEMRSRERRVPYKELEEHLQRTPLGMRLHMHSMGKWDDKIFLRNTNGRYSSDWFRQRAGKLFGTRCTSTVPHRKPSAPDTTKPRKIVSKKPTPTTGSSGTGAGSRRRPRRNAPQASQGSVSPSMHARPMARAADPQHTLASTEAVVKVSPAIPPQLPDSLGPLMSQSRQLQRKDSSALVVNWRPRDAAHADYFATRSSAWTTINGQNPIVDPAPLSPRSQATSGGVRETLTQEQQAAHAAQTLQDIMQHGGSRRNPVTLPPIRGTLLQERPSSASVQSLTEPYGGLEYAPVRRESAFHTYEASQPRRQTVEATNSHGNSYYSSSSFVGEESSTSALPTYPHAQAPTFQQHQRYSHPAPMYPSLQSFRGDSINSSSSLHSFATSFSGSSNASSYVPRGSTSSVASPPTPASYHATTPSDPRMSVSSIMNNFSFNDARPSLHRPASGSAQPPSYPY